MKTYDVIMTPSDDGSWVLKSEADAEIRRLQRALYNLRACYADMMQKRYIECKTDGWVHRVDKWIEVERRCLKKAEEYK